MQRIHIFYFRIIVGFLFICTINFADAANEAVPYDKILRDASVIAPGIGSDGVLINEEINTVILRFVRTKFKISKPRYSGELFINVFKIKSKKRIFFESIYYHEENKFAAFVFQGKVVALIGFDNNRITTDSVNLRSGINSFIFYYGNRNLYLLKANSNGIYIYPGRGIAVMDDGMNDSIDLYLIFAIDTINKS
jgi:hypothetical protein